MLLALVLEKQNLKQGFQCTEFLAGWGRMCSEKENERSRTGQERS